MVWIKIMIIKTAPDLRDPSTEEGRFTGPADNSVTFDDSYLHSYSIYYLHFLGFFLDICFFVFSLDDIPRGIAVFRQSVAHDRIQTTRLRGNVVCSYLPGKTILFYTTPHSLVSRYGVSHSTKFVCSFQGKWHLIGVETVATPLNRPIILIGRKLCQQRRTRNSRNITLMCTHIFFSLVISAVLTFSSFCKYLSFYKKNLKNRHHTGRSVRIEL